MPCTGETSREMTNTVAVSRNDSSTQTHLNETNTPTHSNLPEPKMPSAPPAYEEKMFECPPPAYDWQPEDITNFKIIQSDEANTNAEDKLLDSFEHDTKSLSTKSLGYKSPSSTYKSLPYSTKAPGVKVEILYLKQKERNRRASRRAKRTMGILGWLFCAPLMVCGLCIRDKPDVNDDEEWKDDMCLPCFYDIDYRYPADR